MRKAIYVLFVASLLVAGTAYAGFDQYGYNDTARLFNGTASQWCLAKGMAADCQGVYSNDKLVMKWTSAWDQGNAEGWTGSYPDAWETNEWNGKIPGGSGQTWHYKIIWVGAGLEASPYWRDGGYPIWGQFEVIMDQGTDPNVGPGHVFFAKAAPNGFGATH